MDEFLSLPAWILFRALILKDFLEGNFDLITLNGAISLEKERERERALLIPHTSLSPPDFLSSIFGSRALDTRVLCDLDCCPHCACLCF